SRGKRPARLHSSMTGNEVVFNELARRIAHQALVPIQQRVEIDKVHATEFDGWHFVSPLQSQQVKEMEDEFLALYSNVFLCKVISATDEQRVQTGAFALTGSARIHRWSAARLLRLQRFDVLGEVYHALLHLTLVSTTHTPKRRSPHRHLLGSVRGSSGFAADGGRDSYRGIFPSVVLAQQGKVGGRNLQRAGRGTSAFAVDSMANGTVCGVHFLARYRRRGLDRDMLYGFLGLALRLVL